MDYIEKKEQDYTKWDQTIWLSVEKEISQFQQKVTGCMLDMGSLKKTKVQDFKVEPLLDDEVILGQDIYLQIIRPICVSKGYMPKKIPTEQDLQDDEDDDSKSEEQQKKTKASKMHQKKQLVVKQAKKSAKKGSKSNQSKNINEITLKITKQNLQKDIQILLDTHSLQRMQFEFGLKQKKIQLKLITFFYIAYFIRKNKEKQKIDETDIFQLVNILIKIVRIYDGYKGKSFFSGEKKKKKDAEEQLLEVSPTLILDIKVCIKALKQIYNYSNKKIIINYPKLVYYTNYDRFFPTLDIKPYPSQIQFIQAVKSAFNQQKGSIAKPTLILYRTMIGSGKTSASLSLSNLINETKLLDQKNQTYQLLYSCVIGSVRIQVGRYAYNKNQKFALAAMEKSIKDEDYYYPRIINSYSCRGQKYVDLVISDLKCTYQMLSHHHLSERQEQIFQHEQKNRKKAVNVGMIDKENIILFIDEPTAFCKDIDSPATVNLFRILANFPPRIIVLASATMPPKDQLKNTIALIEQKNPGLQVFEIQSKQFQIGCQYSSFKGEIIFPHTGVKNKEQLKHIIDLVEKNPFLLRLYTGPSLYFLLKKCQSLKIKGIPSIDVLPEIRQEHISKATMIILNAIYNSGDDAIIEQACKLSADQANIDYKLENVKQSDSDDDIFGEDEQVKEKEQTKKNKGDYVNFKHMLRADAHKFLGGCLIATENPLQFAKKHFSKWMIINRKQKQSIKSIRRLLQKYKRQVEALQKQIKLLEDDDRRDDTITKQITKIQFEKQPRMDFPDYKRINTIDHYNRYCPEKQSVHVSMLIKPIPIELVAQELIQQTDDFVLKLLCCGVALYMEKGLSPKYLDKVEELASQNYLAFIITDQSLCYGTNFPISNVILLDDLVCKLNMNEMFQLIGRAGRVGQSWTARAFLQEKGLQKLSQYIHSEDQKMSQQAQIFEAIAKQYLDHPELSLRTSKSEIKYLNIERPDNRVEIIVKKKQKKDYHIFRKVTIVAYLNDAILSRHEPYQSINCYSLPQSDILYEDLPTKPNSKNEQVINVQLYYKNQQQFIRNTLDNACKRILKTTLDEKISSEGQVNQFKPKVYEDFFNFDTNTFAILIKCKQNTQVGNYSFNKLKSNSVQKLDENMVSKIQNYIAKSKRQAKQIHKNPQSLYQNEAKQVRSIHEDLMERPKTKFYSQIFKQNVKAAEEVYSKLTSHIDDKTSLQTAQQSKIVLFVDMFSDFANVENNLFHVDATVRAIWPNILAAIQKNPNKQ